MNPRIGIDASATVGPRTGIGHAAAQLLDAMLQVWPAPWPPPTVLVYGWRHEPPADDPWMQAPAKRLVRRPIPGRWLLRAWQYAGWPPVERLAGSVELFHSLGGYLVPSRRARRVVTVHDLYFLDAPRDVERLGGRYLARTYARGLARVDRLIAVSNFTRDEIVKHYGVDPARIAVVHHGVDLLRFSPEPAPGDADQLARAGVRPPYLLCVATLEPRKNLPRLIEAYARARRMLQAADQKPPQLVIVGPIGWGVHELEAKLDEASMRDAVTLTGYLPDAAMPAMYRHALGLVLASLCEGFGMPAIEAMACGCPAVLARAGALPEVGGDAALYFDPRDPEGLAQAMVELIASPPRRADLRESGLARARRFSWRAAAQATLEVYRDLLGG